MEDKTIDEMIQAFIENGLDLSQFKFMSDYDKENFFMMYTDLFQSMMKDDDDYDFKITEEKDLFITLNNEEMFLFITDEYQTLRCDLCGGYYDKNNTNQILLLTILFLTIKELKAMIDLFAGEIMKNMESRKSSKYTKLPKSFAGKANYLSSKQEYIMEDIDKAREKVTIKEIK